MYQLKTDSGYLFGEVISALQKSIRRGEEEEAMYWVLELFPKYSNALWTRLTVIVNEDIGLADTQAIILVYALRCQFDALEKEGSKRLVLANCILYLCRSPKSRLADHFQCVINQRRLQKGWRLDIPDHALDKHTARGKRMGRGWEQWFEEGTKLEKESSIVDPYQKEAETLWPTMIKPDHSKKPKSTKGQSPLPFQSESD